MSDDLSPFERALAQSIGHMRNSFGVPVTYTRGATTLTIQNALQGATSKKSIESDNNYEETVVETQEWLIALEDLASLAPPAVGDLIVRNIEGTTYTFTVETLELGEVAWDWSDNGKTQYRIMARKDGASAYEVSEPNSFDISGNEMRYD